MASKEQRQAAIKKAAKTVRAGQTGFVRRASDSPPSGPAEGEEIIPGVRLLTIEFSEEENLRLAGWRETLEEEGQELWRIYHWIVECQGGKTHGIYRLRDWLERFNVPDRTNQQEPPQ